ncbi:MAG: hypothetical protein HZB40_16685 [Rhodocyclales bacterium]|nr:hypothetical protein [Rhodocyclales bacterium]
MIFDSALVFSDRQVVVADTHSDTVEIARLAPGHTLDMHLRVFALNETGSSPTLEVVLETSTDNVTFTPVRKFSKPVGAPKTFGCGLDGVALNRYLRLAYNVGGSSPGFTLFAGLVMGFDQWQAYPAAGIE